MTAWIGVSCDLCGENLLGIDPEEDLESYLESRRWDFDPQVGHRCPKCVRSFTSSDESLEVETVVERETKECRSCTRMVFFGRPERTYGFGSFSLPYNADPHHCGFTVKTATTSSRGTQIFMDGQYHKIEEHHPGPLYAPHQCRKRDLKEVPSEG